MAGSPVETRRKLTSGDLALPAEAMLEPVFAALAVGSPDPNPREFARKSGSKALPSWTELVVGGGLLRVQSDVNEEHLTRIVGAVTAAS